MSTIATFPSQAESWLDERGKGAWIAAMVLGFILFWPIGLALLFYMIFVKRIFSCAGNSCRSWKQERAKRSHWQAATPPSGNSAFDTYREDTLRRLEEEQAQFEAFLARLRHAKDMAEFDQFMEERAQEAGRTDQEGEGEEDDVQAHRRRMREDEYPGPPPAPRRGAGKFD